MASTVSTKVVSLDALDVEACLLMRYNMPRDTVVSYVFENGNLKSATLTHESVAKHEEPPRRRDPMQG